MSLVYRAGGRIPLLQFFMSLVSSGTIEAIGSRQVQGMVQKVEIESLEISYL